MVNLYVRRVRAGLMTVEQVPLLWRERVRAVVEKTENAQ
ncbi:MAG: CD1375 family protein [Clostridia bacterium]